MTRLEILHRETLEINRVSSKASLKVFAFAYLCIFLLVLAQLIRVIQYLVICIALAPVISWGLNNAWQAQQQRNERKSSTSTGPRKPHPTAANSTSRISGSDGNEKSTASATPSTIAQRKGGINKWRIRKKNEEDTLHPDTGKTGD